MVKETMRLGAFVEATVREINGAIDKLNRISEQKIVLTDTTSNNDSGIINFNLVLETKPIRIRFEGDSNLGVAVSDIQSIKDEKVNSALAPRISFAVKINSK